MDHNDWIKAGDTWINTGTGNLKYVSKRAGDGPFSEPVLKFYFTASGDGFTFPFKSSPAQALIKWLDEQSRDVFAEYQQSLEKAKRDGLAVGDDGELVEVEHE